MSTAPAQHSNNVQQHRTSGHTQLTVQGTSYRQVRHTLCGPTEIHRQPPRFLISPHKNIEVMYLLGADIYWSL